MARDYERDRWGRRYDDDVERYDRDDRRQRMRSDLDYGRERGSGGGYDRERGMGQYGGERNYSDNEVDYGRGYGARRGDSDYGYGGRGHDRDAGVRGGRGREDERLRYRGDDREVGRDRASDDDRNRYRREDERDEDVRGGHRGRGPRDYRRADDRIREEINDRLTDDDYLDASQMEVGVQNGEAILAGYVYNRTSKRRAEQIAERVTGVTNVENRLRVIPYGATAANNWDMRQSAGANQTTDTSATDAGGETETPDTSASVTAGNRST